MSNFQTPDPGIIERPYVQQIPLDALFKNLSYKQEQYDQGLQESKQKVDMLNNIASFGNDTAVKNEMFNKLNEELGKLSGSNYADPNVRSQLDGLISSFTNSKDVANMHSRAVTFEKMQKEEEEARLKGKEYYNPGLDEARNYYSSGTYKKDVTFNNTGNIAPDMEKLSESILKMPNVTYKKADLVNGRVVKYDVVDGKKASEEFLNLANVDPKLNKYLSYKFNSAYGNPDWKQAGVESFRQKANHSLSIGLELEKHLAYNRQNMSPSEISDVQSQIQEYKQNAKEYAQIAQNPSLVGEDYKSMLFNSFKQEEAQKFGRSKELVVKSDIGAESQAYLESLKHANDMAEIQYRNTLERGYDSKGNELKYNPNAAKTKDDKKDEEAILEYGKVLDENYNNLSEEDVRAQLQADPNIGYLVGSGRKVFKEGDNWYAEYNGNKNILLTPTKYKESHIKGATKLQMQQTILDNQNKKNSQKTTPGARKKVEWVTNK